MALRQFIKEIGDMRLPKWCWWVLVIVFFGGPFFTLHISF